VIGEEDLAWSLEVEEFDDMSGYKRERCLVRLL
jgi:hypothetical protein